MKKPFWKTGLLILISIAFLLSGCSFTINLGDTTPTSEPPAIVVTTQNGSENQPTQSTNMGTSTSTYTLSTTQFEVNSKAFSVYPPEGWEDQSTSPDIQVRYIAPDGSITITTQFTNTGYPLDQTAFENYINGTQDNKYSSEANYSEQSRELHLDQDYGIVFVTFTYNNIPQKAERKYQQQENVIYETEIWADADKWDQNVDFFNQYLNGISFEQSNVSNYEPYMFIDSYTNAGNLFSFNFFIPWEHLLNQTNDEYFTSEGYLAPDRNASIDAGNYNDSKTSWTTGDAKQWVINKLEANYANGSGDLNIDSDQMNSNGYEQLNWHSVQNKETGITVFTAKDTRIAVLTVAWLDSYAGDYQSSMEYVITTFASPAQ